MSSFRPTIEREAPSFVAIPIHGSIADAEAFGFESAAADAIADSLGAEGHDAGAVVDEPAGVDPAEVEAREAEAYARGLEAGRVEAASIDDACAALEGAAERLEAMGNASLAANREGLIALAASIARRWVARELEVAPDVFVGLLDAAVARLPEETAPRVRLAPADAARVEAARAATAEAEAARWFVEVDPALESGEFLVEGEQALVDGRAKAVLAELEANLSAALEAPEPNVGVDGSDDSEVAS